MTDLVQQIVRTAAAMAAMGQAVTAVRLAVPLAPGAVPLLSLVPKVSACGISPPVAPGVAVRGCERPEDWRMALAPQPLDVLDAQYLEAAWALGAWDVARTERAPLPVGADPADPMYGIAHLLHDPYVIRFIGQAPEPMPCPVDGAAWAQQAARHGWLVWLCKPLLYGPAIRAGWIAKDRTLRADGGRDPRAEPWRAWQPVYRGHDHQSVIRLGRAPHGNRRNARH